MKNYLQFAALGLMLASPFAHSAAPDWETAVRQFDTAYWDAYNRCDVEQLVAMNSADLEFYHDQGGLMVGQQQFASAMKNNICGNPQQRVRRAALADTVRVYPMRDKGQPYGAVIAGEHQFYNQAKGGAEVLAGTARFTHMLVLKDGTWKVARVLSFDHGPARAAQKNTEIQLTAPLLDRFAGTYKAKDNMVLKVRRVGNHLMVDAGGTMFELLPLSDTTFFVEARDLSVVFSTDAAGKGQGLVVREHGAVVAEASIH